MRRDSPISNISYDLYLRDGGGELPVGAPTGFRGGAHVPCSSLLPFETPNIEVEKLVIVLELSGDHDLTAAEQTQAYIVSYID
jgi:hypothetical protein